MVFGKSLRTAVDADPKRFDRVQIMSEVEAPIKDAARTAIRGLGPKGGTI